MRGITRGYRLRNAQTDGGARPESHAILSASCSSLPQTMRPFSVSHGEYTYIIPDFRFFVKRYGERFFSSVKSGLCGIFTPRITGGIA